MIKLSGQPLTLAEIEAVAFGKRQVSIDSAAILGIEKARALVENIVADDAVVYGISTGFGKLSEVKIPAAELKDLQLNLVRSHACGVGNPLSIPEVRVMLLLRANVLAKGFSGARLLVLETLLQMLEKGVHPVIPEKGSVGASGDLAPLAHLALVLLGEGEAFYDGVRMAGDDAMQWAGIPTIELEAKEGLALLNGTQAICAVGGLALARAQRVAHAADVVGAMTLEALLGTPTAFDPRIHQVRPHSGQMASASHLMALLEDSEIRMSHLEDDPRVQDAYSLRCMPQVHGAVRDALNHVQGQIETESGSATDNPLVFANEGDVISGGNFHGAPLALALDYASIAITDLSSISERRIDRMVNPDLNEHLPAFLTAHPGTSSGFMIPHVTAVALLNECKVLSHPSSVDNAPTSGGKEDHVSMGMTGALKLRQIVTNAEQVLAIEMLAAAEGLEYRKPLKPGKGALKAYETVRSHVSRLDKDRSMTADIERIALAIRDGEFDGF
ncbi:MAG: histidine ammonia-lyase [Fimbriimonadaceae bacterium]|nr:histidine ammonia-lyase [Fimbriimonadaceae bacterium]